MVIHHQENPGQDNKTIMMMMLMTMLVILNLLKLNFFLALHYHLDKTTAMMMILMTMLVIFNLLKLNFLALYIHFVKSSCPLCCISCNLK